MRITDWASLPSVSKRPGQLFVHLSMALLAVKLMNAIPALLRPTGVPRFIPESGGLSGITLTGLWVISTIVLLGLRMTIGAISALCFCLISIISGVSQIRSGYMLWGSWQALTAGLVVLFVILAITFGSFVRSHTPSKGEQT